ncbi:hypothetical protein [Papillibacter cinnamivorans]|uniref:Uncharacterized protein n=1 Tax=Papillibacter cinnamivorans DSM 12816 TaxID=1122930 RepID=A0A1W1YYY7_9FIRM|nr:hypothetical protein [Papillibacter cinnamivorans]SMC40898.1 hypothetical protein SAMN02745168_0755 [Papillibacter cinnamivorans DSM 12816]
MLFGWQKELKKYISESIPGYDFICRIPVFIPIQEIGLNVWERRTQNLPFIYECIMTSISLGSKNNSEIAAQFGVPESVMLQIIAQLDADQLVAVSAGNIVLTEKGGQSLKTQKNVQILRKQFSRIFINQITGEVTDTSPVGTYREPPYNQVYLQEIYPISLEFLHNRFDTLSTIYRESRIENTVFFSNFAPEVELYRILDISYHTLSYIKDYCFVYINREDKSLSFKFSSGFQVYADAFQEQINQRMNGAWRLLSQPQKPICLSSTLEVDESPEQLINILNVSEKLDQHLDIFENAYYQDRPLLDGEIYDILYNCNIFKPERILIEVPYLGDFFSDSIITSILTQTTKEVIIHYDLNDHSAKSIIEKLHEKTDNRQNFKLTIVAKKRNQMVKLYFGNECTITGCYYPKDTVYRRHIYKLCAHVSFDYQSNQHLWDEINIDA